MQFQPTLNRGNGMSELAILMCMPRHSMEQLKINTLMKKKNEKDWNKGISHRWIGTAAQTSINQEVLRNDKKPRKAKTIKNMRGLAPLIVLLNFKWRTVRPTNYCGDTLPNREMSVLASVSGPVAIPTVHWYVCCRNGLRASAHIIAFTPTTSAENVSFCGIQYSQYLDLREWMNVKHFFRSILSLLPSPQNGVEEKWQ